ncbi:hypothetical protein [Microcoleus sp. CAWBG58]|uniref:hypothetical protein n=1 Tax=Microcoleus sp. CAWBG58 TaxID=2841651 RepID=UPI0025DC283E|nr:hypothetical protein [Microcoleus sp. CAWBG58]
MVIPCFFYYHWISVNCQLSTVNYQLSTINCQLSTVNCQNYRLGLFCKSSISFSLCLFTSFGFTHDGHKLTKNFLLAKLVSLTGLGRKVKLSP